LTAPAACALIDLPLSEATMGGNSVSSTTTRVRTRPTTTHRGSAKLTALVKELKELSKTEQRDAIRALRTAGLDELADALKALLPSGSRPRERT
jgi:hypothetical protein